jgi:hypothetical protein
MAFGFRPSTPPKLFEWTPKPVPEQPQTTPTGSRILPTRTRAADGSRLTLRTAAGSADILRPYDQTKPALVRFMRDGHEVGRLEFTDRKQAAPAAASFLAGLEPDLDFTVTGFHVVYSGPYGGRTGYDFERQNREFSPVPSWKPGGAV